MGSLSFFEETFARVGWFIPPYIQMGVLSRIAGEIKNAGETFSQSDLQQTLEQLYEADGLAAMVLHRYSIAPVIREYKITIREAIEAHFLGLDHVAVGGLMPVIEGAGRRLAADRGIVRKSTQDLFACLANDCKEESRAKNLGATEEVASMMDSFNEFARKSFFVDSREYPFDDGANRHGVAHGVYSDDEYGKPISFYKTIAAIDFLTFIASFRAHISWLAPAISRESARLSSHYRTLRMIKVQNAAIYEID
jgi:hypothetical protein